MISLKIGEKKSGAGMDFEPEKATSYSSHLHFFEIFLRKDARPPVFEKELITCGLRALAIVSSGNGYFWFHEALFC